MRLAVTLHIVRSHRGGCAANPDPVNNVTWELYDLTKDFSQNDDIAAQHPDKVKELKALFMEEARKYQVLPMDASVAARIVAPRPNITAERTEFVYTRPMVGLPQGDSPFMSGLGCSGTGVLKVDGQVVATQAMPHALPMILQWDGASTSAQTRSPA